MKYTLFFIAFFSIQMVFSQDITVDTHQEVILDTENYSMASVEIIPEFPGGMQEFYKYIGRNFRTPDDKGFKGGKLFMSFVIDKDGSIIDIKAVRDLGYGTAAEAIRVLEKSPKWKPGVSKGKVVRVSYMLPITLQAN